MAATEAKSIRDSVVALQARKDAIESTAAIAAASRELAEVQEKRITREQYLQLEAERESIDLLSAAGQQWANIKGQVFDIRRAQEDKDRALKQAGDGEQRVNDLLSYRQLLLDKISDLRDNGQGRAADALEGKLEGVNGEIQAAIAAARAMWEAIGGAESLNAIAALEAVSRGLVDIHKNALISGQAINDQLVNGGAGALESFAQNIVAGRNAIEAFGQVFASVAAEFLANIARMIAQQEIFNLLQINPATGGGGAGGVIQGLLGSLFHSGGVAGAAAPGQRRVPAAVFADAIRYHSGGVAGLAPNEVPAILKRGEEVLTESDARHRNNGGGKGDSPRMFSQVIAVGEDQIAKAMLAICQRNNLTKGEASDCERVVVHLNFSGLLFNICKLHGEFSYRGLHFIILYSKT